MKKSLELQAELSKARQAIAEFNAIDEPSKDQLNEVEKRAEGIVDLERRLRLALTEEETAEQRSTQEEPENREWAKMISQAKISNYLQAVLSGSDVVGVEKELRSELGLAMNQFPVDLLGNPEIEKRDAPTPAPAADDQAKTMAPIAPRVFADTVASRFGVAMPSVPTGVSAYPFLDIAPAAPAPYADDAVVVSTAGSFTVEDVEPERIAGRVSLRGKDTVRLSGLEDALRVDMTRSLADAVDKQILFGDGTGANLTGLMHNRAAANTSATKADFASVVADCGGLVDGLYARQLNHVHLLCTPKLRQFFISLFRANESEVTAEDWLMDKLGGYSTTANLPAAVSDVENTLVWLSGSGLPRSAVAPLWRGVTVTRDAVTDVAKDWIHLTIAVYQGLAILHGGAMYKALKFKTA